MPRKLTQHKIAYLFSKLSLGELQGHTTVTRIVKAGRKPKEGVDNRPIVKRPRTIKGTGIPASTLKRIRDRKVTPSKQTIKRLTALYHRWQYHKLRASGANYKNAKSFKTHAPHKIKTIIQTYTRSARKIQYNYEQTYHDRVKAYRKQERDKLLPPKPVKPPKPPKPAKILKPIFPDPTDEPLSYLPDHDEGDEPIVSTGIFDPSTTYLDTTEDEEEPEYVPEEPQELSEPRTDDYPTLDEVLYGMSESEHDYNEWDDIAGISGLDKK